MIADLTYSATNVRTGAEGYLVVHLNGHSPATMDFHPLSRSDA